VTRIVGRTHVARQPSAGICDFRRGVPAGQLFRQTVSCWSRLVTGRVVYGFRSGDLSTRRADIERLGLRKGMADDAVGRAAKRRPWSALMAMARTCFAVVMTETFPSGLLLEISRGLDVACHDVVTSGLVGGAG